MYLLKRWHGNLHLLQERRATAIQFPSTFNPPTQQPPTSTSATSHHANIADDDEEMINADDLNKTWRKIYNALRQETIPRDVRSSLLPNSCSSLNLFMTKSWITQMLLLMLASNTKTVTDPHTAIYRNKHIFIPSHPLTQLY